AGVGGPHRVWGAGGGQPGPDRRRAGPVGPRRGRGGAVPVGGGAARPGLRGGAAGPPQPGTGVHLTTEERPARARADRAKQEGDVIHHLDTDDAREATPPDTDGPPAAPDVVRNQAILTTRNR